MKPDLHGSRIVLRSIQTNDSDDLFEIYGDNQTMEFASDPVFTSEDMVVQMLESVVRLEKSGVNRWNGRLWSKRQAKLLEPAAYIALVIAVIPVRSGAY